MELLDSRTDRRRRRDPHEDLIATILSRIDDLDYQRRLAKAVGEVAYRAALADIVLVGKDWAAPSPLQPLIIRRWRREMEAAHRFHAWLREGQEVLELAEDLAGGGQEQRRLSQLAAAVSDAYGRGQHPRLGVDMTPPAGVGLETHIRMLLIERATAVFGIPQNEASLLVAGEKSYYRSTAKRMGLGDNDHHRASEKLRLEELAEAQESGRASGDQHA